MILRPYEADDYYQLTNLYKVPSLYGGNFDESRDTNKKLQRTSDEGNLFVVVDEVNLVVGSVMFLRNAHSFWLLRFVLDDRHIDHEQVGSMLVHFAEQEAKKDGHTNVIVYSSPLFKELAHRYAKLNFKKGNTYTSFWKEII